MRSIAVLSIAVTTAAGASGRMIRACLRIGVAVLLMAASHLPASAQAPETSELLDRVCTLIEAHAEQNALPAAFLARLIWKESRFDPNAVSPKGAEGIAQFMPGTAALRGLKDAFDIAQAIPASAAYLAELKDKYGNLGLAAAAYNAGEARVSRWLSAGGFLPLETEEYVLGILGEPADRFADGSHSGTVPPLDAERPFDDACRDLPASDAVTVAMASVPIKPWGAQVAGHFRRDVAARQWERIRAKYTELLGGYEPVLSRMRSPRGRRGIYTVRIGAETRDDAEDICGRLKNAGASCIVLRNR